MHSLLVLPPAFLHNSAAAFFPIYLSITARTLRLYHIWLYDTPFYRRRPPTSATYSPAGGILVLGHRIWWWATPQPVGYHMDVVRGKRAASTDAGFDATYKRASTFFYIPHRIFYAAGSDDIHIVPRRLAIVNHYPSWHEDRVVRATLYLFAVLFTTFGLPVFYSVRRRFILVAFQRMDISYTVCNSLFTDADTCTARGVWLDVVRTHFLKHMAHHNSLSYACVPFQA